ncbi:MAG: hypothetical protein IPH45_21310 [Bacteroidales bacterium]|nr:hypothetical protein [Bacteroidales bacterium]
MVRYVKMVPTLPGWNACRRIWSGTWFPGTVEAGFVFDPSSGTQTLTYTYTDGNSCVNASQAIISVLDLPLVSAGTYAAVCVDAADITLAGSPAGGVWTGTGVSGSIETGFVFDPSVGTQSLTYSFTDGNSCSTSDQVVITINQLPVIVAGSYGPVCIDADFWHHLPVDYGVALVFREALKQVSLLILHRDTNFELCLY